MTEILLLHEAERGMYNWYFDWDDISVDSLTVSY